MVDAYIDKLSSFMGVAFGLIYFLAFGLEIGEHMQDMFLNNISFVVRPIWFLSAIAHNSLHLVVANQCVALDSQASSRKPSCLP